MGGDCRAAGRRHLRRQLLGLGLSPRQARRRLDSGHWRTAHPGVYLTFTGPPPDLTRVWTALLWAGPGAVAGGRTALWLGQALADLPEPIEIIVPHSRRAQPVPGVRIHRSRNLAAQLHLSANPPRIRLESAVLDVAGRQARAEPALDVVLRAVQQRLTSADRLFRQLREQPRQRWRPLLDDVLAEVVDGVTSPLELRYSRNVERAHGLPRGRRNGPEGPPGARRYRDVRYPRWRLLVELDGREAHPLDQAFRDLRRDNEATLAGDRVLRYGWRDVAGRPCTVATQVISALQAEGWTGRPKPCGPNCPVRN